MPLAPEVPATEKVSPVPVIDSTSEMTAVLLRVTPEGCTVAEAVAVVSPGTAMPVTLSV